MTTYLEDLEWLKHHPNGPGSDYDSDDTSLPGERRRKEIPRGPPMPIPDLDMTEEELEGDNVEFIDRGYTIHPKHFRDILKFLRWHQGDVDGIMEMYSILDTKSEGNASVRDTLVTFLPICCTSVEDCIRTACVVFDLDDTKTVGYGVLLHIFLLLIRGIEFFGDKIVTASHCKDVVDSIFTMEGKMEGFICYDDYMSFILKHPVLILFSSHQFQGIGKDKYKALNDYAHDLQVNFDRPMWRDTPLLKDDDDDDDNEENN
jgi:hypothetical protein